MTIRGGSVDEIELTTNCLLFEKFRVPPVV